VQQASKIDGRPANTTPVKRVLPGAEPVLFTCWFQSWRTGAPDAYERSLAALRAAQQNTAAILDVREALQEYNLPEGTTFPYVILRERPLPNNGRGMDLSRLEIYLNDDEFQEVFRMTKQEFEAAKEWRKTELRKRTGLF